MSKQKAISELKKLHPLAELEHSASCGSWDTLIHAPDSMNWGGDMHSYVIHQNVSDRKLEYWADVIQEIKTMDQAVICTELSCCCWDLESNSCGVTS
ncbi:hypothetical protein GD1_159 [Paraglaciecola Antarctic GD virus 1]|nr:hypothetical protein GD1_159 [Paraglaciecola Antarctic GD virus 1]